MDADVDAGIEFNSNPASTYSFTLTSGRNATQTKYCEPGLKDPGSKPRTSLVFLLFLNEKKLIFSYKNRFKEINAGRLNVQIPYMDAELILLFSQTESCFGLIRPFSLLVDTGR